MSWESVPSEIVERILLSEVLDFTDILNISATCARLKDVCRSNKVWDQLFTKQYNALHHVLRREVGAQDWRQHFIDRYRLGISVDQLVGSMSNKFYQQTELSASDFQEFDLLLMEANPQFSFRHVFVMDHLNSLLTGTGPGVNITNKYYGYKVARHIQHRLLTPEVLQFSRNSDSPGPRDEVYEQYEKVLVLIAQWCQPHLNLDKVLLKQDLDRLADKVFQRIHVSGNVDTASIKYIDDLRALDKDPHLCRQIMDCANEFLQMEGFRGNSTDYYVPENSYINCVLKTKLGIPISLSLLYLCLMGRMGISCEPVNFPRHFLLRWLEHPELTDSSHRFSYIDVFNGGRRMNGTQALALLGPELVPTENMFQVSSPLSAAQRMTRNLISIGASHSSNMRDSSYSLLRSSLELMILLNAEERSDFSFMLSRVYLQLNINHEETVKLLSAYAQTPGLEDQVNYLLTTTRLQLEEKTLETKEIIPKRRDGDFPNGEVRLHVGMVACHKRYNYRCVVYGWDRRCKASQSWINQMGVHRLQRKELQPFYNVLVDDGSSRYAADENLEACEPVLISNSEAGKFFKEFCPNRGYLPNSELSREYPDDKFGYSSIS